MQQDFYVYRLFLKKIIRSFVRVDPENSRAGVCVRVCCLLSPDNQVGSMVIRGEEYGG